MKVVYTVRPCVLRPGSEGEEAGRVLVELDEDELWTLSNALHYKLAREGEDLRDVDLFDMISRILGSRKYGEL